ncbi:alcohol dehydrogenase [Frankia sp. CcI49]|uniref:NDMA-dependent alcohol dehydrogenase n=1 Tax=Frankia sp. CcI49 TaxID=1745382 RepID=UPI0009780607|nr:NDMA-dependent alcohol dehydrogenase [Frankia sp. CcI49]ONH59305.1 alcohol dehydrogenase [Frankia sp. CcI49]
MKTKAAVLMQQPGEWEVVETDLDGPRDGEVLVRMVAAGLCHSDDHVAKADGKIQHFPYCGGHEGAGVVEDVGPGVRSLKPGDHIVTSFIPGCGRCAFCASGHQNLCQYGALIMHGSQLDGTYRTRYQGQDVARSSLIGAFAEYSVMSEWSAVRIPDHVPLRSAAMLGCGVPTGWGSAVNAAQVTPGQVVIVMGVGGIGINAVQGAAHAGAGHVIAVDPVPLKRETALKLGATGAFSSIEEAAEFARSITNGQGADSTVVTVGVLNGEHLGQAFDSVRKGGVVVVTAVAPMTVGSIPVSPFMLAMFEKRLQGCLYGSMSPSGDIPRLLAMYENGQLKLDELVTTTYSLDEINVGYRDMHAGRNIRGLIEFPVLPR